MGFKFVNFFDATLQQSIAAAATTCYVEAAQEALLPALVGGDLVRAVLYDGDLAPEIVDISAHSAGALTITRALEGTVAQDWPAGTRVTTDLTAALAESVLNVTAALRFAGTATGTNDLEIELGAGATLPVPSDGDELTFRFAGDNTGAMTVTVTDDGTNDIGPNPLVHPDGEDLEAGDAQGTWYATVRWSASLSAWVLTSQGSYNEHAYQMNDGPLVSANQLSNGAFRAWNAATSFSDPVTGTTVADGYYIEHDGTIGNFTVSRQAFTLGQTDVGGNPKYFLRWAHTVAGSGSTYRRLRTKVSQVGYYAGKKVIRSIWAKADSARNVTAKFIQHFGTGGSPSADVEAESVTWNLTTTWTRFEIPDTLPSISGKTLGSNADDALILSLDLPVNTTMTIEFAMDQFEYGHIASDPGSEWPLDVRKGGTGGAYASFAALAAALEAAGGPWLTEAELIAKANVAITTNDALLFLDDSDSDLIKQRPVSSIITDLALARYDQTQTWTQAQSFSGAITLTSTSGLTISSSTPRFILSEGDQAADEKNWLTIVSAKEWALATATDATPTTAVAKAIAIARGTGTALSSIALGAPLLEGLGATGAPSYSFSGDTNTGMWSSGADIIDFSTGGVMRFQVTNTFCFVNVPAIITAGSAAAPSLRFVSDSDTGFYQINTSNEIGLSLGGVLQVDFATTGVTFVPPVLGPAGAVGAPSFSFAGDPNTGIYNQAANVLGFACDGVLQFLLTATTFAAQNGNTLQAGNGAVGAPGLSFKNETDCGLYVIGANNIGMALGGVLYMDWSTTRVLIRADPVLETGVTPTSTQSLGYRGSPSNSGEKSGNFTGVAVDAGGSVPFTAAAQYTIPTNASVPHPLGTTIHLPSLNGGGNLTVHPDTGVTLRRGDGTAGTGDRIVAADSGATLWKRGTNEWYLFGPQS